MCVFTLISSESEGSLGTFIDWELRGLCRPLLFGLFLNNMRKVRVKVNFRCSFKRCTCVTMIWIIYCRILDKCPFFFDFVFHFSKSEFWHFGLISTFYELLTIYNFRLKVSILGSDLGSNLSPN